MPTRRLCACGAPLPFRATGKGRQREWCTDACRNHAYYRRKHPGATPAEPEPSEVADNVTAELDDGQWPVDIAGRRALTVARLRQLLIAAGWSDLAHRLDDRPC